MYENFTDFFFDSFKPIQRWRSVIDTFLVSSKQQITLINLLGKNRRKYRNKQKFHRQRRKRRARMKYQSKFVKLMNMSTTKKTINAFDRMKITSSEGRNEFEFISRHQITRHHALKMHNNDRPQTSLDQLDEQQFCSVMSEINSYSEGNDHHSSFV